MTMDSFDFFLPSVQKFPPVRRQRQGRPHRLTGNRRGPRWGQGECADLYQGYKVQIIETMPAKRLGLL